MYILGIETSCDETAVSILDIESGKNFKILSEVVFTQEKVHELYGGVVPELAAREHLTAVTIVFEKALLEANLKLKDIDCICVTRGPGLKGSLLIGYNFAKGVCSTLNKSFIGVNHIEGHILSVQLDNPALEFPFLSLIASGGHTELIQVNGLGDYSVISRTTDDAAGEAFDKAANLLGIPYPGGAALAAIADTVTSSTFSLPRVMHGKRDFSFSGLKTAISLLIQKESKNLEAAKAELCYAIQNSIVEALIDKVDDAVKITGIKNLGVAGGVSANACLRRKLTAKKNVTTYFPENKHTTDNATMIAYAGGLRYLRGDITPLKEEVLARWPVETLK